MVDLELVHLLLVLVLLLGFLHLQLLVVTIQIVQFLGLFLFHLVVSLDK